MELGDFWERQAEDWVRWAREPDHDSYWLFHRDRFLEHRPLEDYFLALEGSALVVERLREIVDTSDDEGAVRWRRIPLFLHIRAAHARVGSDG
jgi:hypothetical protein